MFGKIIRLASNILAFFAITKYVYDLKCIGFLLSVCMKSLLKNRNSESGDSYSVVMFHDCFSSLELTIFNK